MKTIFVVLTLAGGLFFAGGPARAIEEPAFKTVLRGGAFELRDYPGLIVAEVTIVGEQKEAASKGFRLLAGYIFGGNRRRQSIAMTAPVAQEGIRFYAIVQQRRVPNQLLGELLRDADKGS